MDIEIQRDDLMRTLLNHPQIASWVNVGVSGGTFIDHIIGLIEQVSHPDGMLRGCYAKLKEEYPLHFRNGSGPSMESKREGYKAPYGF